MSMNIIDHIRLLLRQAATIPKEKQARFFKVGAGDYAAHDQFIGVPVPAIRAIAREYKQLGLADLELLIQSPFNEERLLALIIVVHQYQKATGAVQEKLYQWYLRNSAYVNNWNLVDSSAHLIIGAHLLGRDRSILSSLAQSSVLWERRIAIVATWYFIRHDDLACTYKIAELLLSDTHDLIHKAVGWMLREAGKKDQASLVAFLERYRTKMPRIMYRYAIERLHS